MLFHDVARSFDAIDAESSRLAMTELLAQLFSHSSAQEIGVLCYLTLGSLRPPYEGTAFTIAEKAVIKVLARLLNEPEAQIAARGKKLGDFGSLAVEGTWRVDHALSLLQVYEHLCALENISGSGAQEEKSEALYALLASVDPLSAKYIVRIIVGKLRLGFLDMTILDALSWMAAGDKSLRKPLEHAYNLCADIGQVAQVLKRDGIKGIERMTIQVGIPIRPAAAERLPSAQAIFDKLGPCVAQQKLDGFRLQVHVDKSLPVPLVRFFSRNLLDMSHMFPDLVQACINLPCSSIICEGEAIVYDPNVNAFLPFQETVKRRRKHDIDQVAQELPLFLFLFDLLYLDGHSVMDKPHRERRALLSRLLAGVKPADRIQLTEEVPAASAPDLERYFLVTLEEGLEGVVVKRLDAPYQPGKRNFNWIKLKRHEEGELADTLDCVILGYYGGYGKRATFGIGAFLVGVLNQAQERFETIAKVGTGLSDADWRELKQRCDEQAVQTCPKNVYCPKELVPDVWVAPGIVCSILADEITQSPVHTAGKGNERLGFALRFPRFVGYRPDKGAEEITTAEEVQRLYADQGVRSAAPSEG